MLITGMGVGRGAAVGHVLRKNPRLPEPLDTPFTGDPDAEWERASTALAATSANLMERSEQVDGEARSILQALADEATDPALADEVEKRIWSGKSAERAVFESFVVFRELFEKLGGYQAERGADLDDLSQRTIASLRGEPAPGVPESTTPFVLVAEDLAPADTALLDLTVVLALVTEGGGPTSHTAILARAKSLPAVVGATRAARLEDGMTVLVDAAAGTVETDPSQEDVAEALARDAEIRAETQQTHSAGALADGTPIPLLANVGSSEEAVQALTLGAEGVGLFRTELTFLDSQKAPTKEEQSSEYRALLTAFRGKKVVVRVLDSGADKPLAFLGGGDEANPALGLRGLRVLRQAETVLRDQLRALAIAEKESGAELWVMAPMVADSEDTEYFVKIARECGLQTVGVMVEIPSAALLAQQVLAHCDFISLGTNDLTQYTLAADRQLGSVAAYQNPWHPAVLRLASHRHGRRRWRTHSKARRRVRRGSGRPASGGRVSWAWCHKPFDGTRRTCGRATGTLYAQLGAGKRNGGGRARGRDGWSGARSGRHHGATTNIDVINPRSSKGITWLSLEMILAPTPLRL